MAQMPGDCRPEIIMKERMRNILASTVQSEPNQRMETEAGISVFNGKPEYGTVMI